MEHRRNTTGSGRPGFVEDFVDCVEGFMDFVDFVDFVDEKAHPCNVKDSYQMRRPKKELQTQEGLASRRLVASCAAGRFELDLWQRRARGHG